MNAKKLPLYIIIVFFFFCRTVFAAGPVWKVSKGDDVVFVGGTIHILTEGDYPLPKAFMDAYRQTDEVMFEVDAAKMNTPEFQQELGPKVIYPDGKTIRDFITPETFKKVEKHLADRSIPSEGLIKLRVGMFTITLTIIELQRLGLLGTGVDQFFTLQARNDSKSIEFLETVDEQVQLLLTMGEGYENEIVENTLGDLPELAEDMASLKKQWREGDVQGMMKDILTPMQEEFPAIYKNIIYNRNVNWLPRLEALFGNDNTEFVMVGMLHLVGENGVIQLLEKKGYQVEQMN